MKENAENAILVYEPPLHPYGAGAGGVGFWVEVTRTMKRVV